jgi:hypothetical protein
MAGEERQALVEFADRICVELGHPVGEEIMNEAPSQPDGTRTRLFSGLLSAEDERLIATARRCLVHIAAALEAGHLKVVSETTYRALLDGAELVMRSELAAGNPPSTLMPSLVFLIALPMVKQDEALELSQRTSALLEQAAG